ncbi:MAG: thiamine phosphate synthase [Acidobacteriota bacterium]
MRMLDDLGTVLCLVTHRRRLAARLRRSDREACAALLDQVEGAVRGGVDLVQIREADLQGAELAQLARECRARLANASARLVINDRLDVAIAANAHGVHLRADGVPPQSARAVAPPRFLVGRSVHTREEAAAVRGADYLVAGTVFDTVSKDGTRLGLEGLAGVVRAAGSRPVLAIGGITPDRIPDIKRAGARGVAVIGALLPAGPTTEVIAEVQNLARALRFAFDTPQGVP